MTEFLDIPSALKHIVDRHGTEALKSHAFIYMLDDYHLFEDKRYFKNILKILVDKGYMESILNCSNDEMKMLGIVDRIIEDYGFSYDNITYLVKAIISSVSSDNPFNISLENKGSNYENPSKEVIFASFENQCLNFVTKYIGKSFQEIDYYLQSKGFRHLLRNFISTVFYGGGAIAGYEDVQITVTLTDIQRMVREVTIAINMPFSLIVEFFQQRCELGKKDEDTYCCRLNKMDIEIKEGYKRNSITFKRFNFKKL